MHPSCLKLHCAARVQQATQHLPRSPFVRAIQRHAAHLLCQPAQRSPRHQRQPNALNQRSNGPNNHQEDDLETNDEYMQASALIDAGFTGTCALLVGWQLHLDVVRHFRWSVSDLQTAAAWSLPAVAAALLVCLPEWGPRIRTVERMHMKRTYGRIGADSSINIDLTRNTRNSADAEENYEQLDWAKAQQSMVLLQAYLLSLWKPPPDSNQVSNDVPAYFLLATITTIARDMLFRGVLFTMAAGFIYDRCAEAGLDEGSLLWFARIFGVVSHETAMWLTAALFVALSVPVLMAVEVTKARQFVRVRTAAPVLVQAAVETVFAVEGAVRDASISGGEVGAGEVSGARTSYEEGSCSSSSSSSSSGGAGSSAVRVNIDGSSSDNNEHSRSISSIPVGSSSPDSPDSSGSSNPSPELQRMLDMLEYMLVEDGPLSGKKKALVAAAVAAAQASSGHSTTQRMSQLRRHQQQRAASGPLSIATEMLQEQEAAHIIDAADTVTMPELAAKAVIREFAAEAVVHSYALQQHTPEDRLAGWVMLLLTGSSELAINCSFAATDNLAASSFASFCSYVVCATVFELLSRQQRKELAAAGADGGEMQSKLRRYGLDN